MIVQVRNRVEVPRGFMAARARALYNVEEEAGARFERDFELPLEGEGSGEGGGGWRLGLVVGPSGSGKSSIGRELARRGWTEGGLEPWGPGPIVEELGAAVSFEKATGALATVGLGDVPAWLRPYGVLSNGEQFRARLARLVLEPPEKVFVDEFSSVVDRQVARVGAGAFAKAWRRLKGGQQCVLLSCHRDIVEWLQPDWVLDTETGELLGKESLQPRPRIEIQVVEEGWRLWKPVFEPHHYLKAAPMAFSTAYVGYEVESGDPIAHLGMSAMVVGKGVREARACRMVVLPEWQGAGVGIAFLEALCERELRGEGFVGKETTTILHTNHPALAVSLRRNPKWRQISQHLHGGLKTRKQDGGVGLGGHFRAVQGFRYGGERYAAAWAAKERAAGP